MKTVRDRTKDMKIGKREGAVWVLSTQASA